MNGQTTIYALADPRTGEVRYVGKTDQRLRRRLTQHVVESARRRDHKSCWIRSLGAEPLIRVLMSVPNELGSAAEVYVIAIYRSIGYRLTNVTEGGAGSLGYRPKRSDEQRARYKVAAKGRRKPPPFTAEHRARISAASRGRHRSTPLTAEHRANIGAAKKGNKFWVGKHHTEETKEKIRQFILSQTHCSKDHEFTERNTYIYRSGRQTGWRKCRTCHREQERERNQRRRQQNVTQPQGGV